MFHDSFGYVRSSSVDYMHCVLQGMTKLLLGLWKHISTIATESVELQLKLSWVSTEFQLCIFVWDSHGSSRPVAAGAQDRVREFNSSSLSLPVHVPDKIRAMVWAGDFIELLAILP